MPSVCCTDYRAARVAVATMYGVSVTGHSLADQTHSSYIAGDGDNTLALRAPCSRRSAPSHQVCAHLPCEHVHVVDTGDRAADQRQCRGGTSKGETDGLVAPSAVSRAVALSLDISDYSQRHISLRGVMKWSAIARLTKRRQLIAISFLPTQL
jgi:hypothetical protein